MNFVIEFHWFHWLASFDWLLEWLGEWIILCIRFIEFHPNVSNASHWLIDWLKETHNSFKKWPLNLWWISSKTIIEVRNITKVATFKSSLHWSYKNLQLLFLWQCFLIFSKNKHPMTFGSYLKIRIAHFL